MTLASRYFGVDSSVFLAFVCSAAAQDNQKTVGVITLEDVLEELVKEIEDEKDTGL